MRRWPRSRACRVPRKSQPGAACRSSTSPPRPCSGHEPRRPQRPQSRAVSGAAASPAASTSGEHEMAELKVTQTKSKIGGTKAQRDSLRSLGLHRIGDSVIKADRPEIRGMIQVVTHLVVVEEVQ